MEVLITNSQDLLKIDLDLIRSVALEIMKFEGAAENSELSLVFCDDDFIQKLNKDYRGKNEPTDVLSFSLDEDDFDHEIKLIGDVVISMETALRQAASMKHPPVLEIVFLLIHGLLHLHGYDHSHKIERKRMRDREVSIFRHLCERQLLSYPDADKPEPLIKRVLGPEDGS